MTTPPPSERVPGPLPTGAQPAPSAGVAPTSCWPTARSTGAAPFHRPEDFPTTTANDGRIAWVLGLLGFIPVPALGLLATSVTMIVVGLRQRRKNPVAGRTGRRAAIFGAVNLLPFVIGTGFLIYAALALPPSVAFVEHPIALSIWILAAVWILVVGPLASVIMGFVGLARPVPRDTAARILADAR